MRGICKSTPFCSHFFRSRLISPDCYRRKGSVTCRRSHLHIIVPRVVVPVASLVVVVRFNHPGVVVVIVVVVEHVVRYWTSSLSSLRSSSQVLHIHASLSLFSSSSSSSSSVSSPSSSTSFHLSLCLFQSHSRVLVVFHGATRVSWKKARAGACVRAPVRVRRPVRMYPRIHASGANPRALTAV